MATKKKFKKLIKPLVAMLPHVMQPTTEVVSVKGSVLIAQGHTHKPSGEPVDPDKFYNQRLPVRLAFNHENRLKSAYQKGGRQGVTNYINKIKNIVNANMP